MDEEMMKTLKNRGERDMSRVQTIGLDISKHRSQVHAEDEHGRKMFNRQLKREEVTAFFAALPPCLVGMEACGGSHHQAREISESGHDVELLHPRRVKPFVINNKTDAADARAICEVVRRPDIDFVNVKTVGQQHLSALDRVRERLIADRTALANQIRGLLHEEGVILPQGIAHLRHRLPGLIEISSQLHEASRILFMELHAELIGLDTKI